MNFMHNMLFFESKYNGAADDKSTFNSSSSVISLSGHSQPFPLPALVKRAA
jgi:hypothetical protein